MANRITHSKLHAFYAAIGRFVMMWAELETYVDILLLKLRAGQPGRLPFQLNQKINLIRKALAGRNASDPLVREAIRIVDEIERLSDTRHDYVHGARMPGGRRCTVRPRRRLVWAAAPDRSHLVAGCLNAETAAFRNTASKITDPGRNQQPHFNQRSARPGGYWVATQEGESTSSVDGGVALVKRR